MATAYRVTVGGFEPYSPVAIENIVGLEDYDTDGIYASEYGEVYLYLPDGGYLFRTVISVPQMIASLKRQLKRNLTREEWNYYIGKNIPYETFIGKEATP